MSAYTSFSTRRTPVSEPILGEAQVPNNTGGYVYKLDPFKTFERFLILGSEGGSYYVSEKKLTREGALNTIEAIRLDGKRAVDLIVAVSHGGRAVKNDPAIFALALAAAAADPATRDYALAVLPQVCRIPTHLFHFLTYVRQFRGFGRGLKRAIASWYNDMEVGKLAFEVVKYQGRDGWTNADALRLSHPKTSDPERNGIYKWVVDGDHLLVPPVIEGFEDLKLNYASARPDPKMVLESISKYGLTREMLPTESLIRADVWEALLPNMGLTALIRNLGNMTKVGLLKPMNTASRDVVNKLLNKETLRAARVHPLSILIALRQYEVGHGNLGHGTWTPVPQIIDALDEAFYMAFQFAEPTGKRFLFALDVSGSMGWSKVAGVNMTPAEASAALALACAKTERDYYIMGFADTFRDLKISPKMRLIDAMRACANMNFGGTNVALPYEWALKNKVETDIVVVITDNEVNQGQHPKQALAQYRQKMGINTKQVVMGMTATPFSVGDPNDPFSLDVAGFDANVPQAIQEFAKL